MVREVILIKLGGSLITDKSRPFVAKKKTINRLMREIKAAASKIGKRKIIIGHGSGSFGHYAAQKYGLKTLGGLTEIHDAAAKLNRLVIESGKKAGLATISFPPSSWILSRNNQPKKAFIKPIRAALGYGFVPVVFGDLIIDISQQGVIFSTEKVFSVLIEGLIKSGCRIEKVIHCGTTDGVYDQNQKTIPLITPKDLLEVKKDLTQAQGFDVTGGMLHKVEQSLALAERYNLISVIINGRKEGELKRAILGKLVQGTLVKK